MHSGRMRARDSFNLAQLTRQMVVSNARQRGAARDPYSVAASVVRETLSVYLRGLKADFPGLPAGVRDVGKGAMSGLLSLSADPPLGSVCIVRAVEVVAVELDLDFGRLRGWVLEGLAETWRFMTRPQLESVADELERALPGNGKLFESFVKARTGLIPSQPPHPAEQAGVRTPSSTAAQSAATARPVGEHSHAPPAPRSSTLL